MSARLSSGEFSDRATTTVLLDTPKMVADFHKRFVCSQTNLTRSPKDVLHAVSWLICLRAVTTAPRSLNVYILLSMKKINNRIPGTAIGKKKKINKLAMLLKTAFRSLLTVNHLTSEKWKLLATPKSDLSTTVEYTLWLSPLNRISFWVSSFQQICGRKLRMRYRMSLIYGHPVISSEESHPFRRPLDQKNSGDDNAERCVRCCGSTWRATLFVPAKRNCIMNVQRDVHSPCRIKSIASRRPWPEKVYLRKKKKGGVDGRSGSPEIFPWF